MRYVLALGAALLAVPALAQQPPGAAQPSIDDQLDPITSAVANLPGQVDGMKRFIKSQDASIKQLVPQVMAVRQIQPGSGKPGETLNWKDGKWEWTAPATPAAPASGDAAKP